ncbi:hypothetical protein F5Y06DRAFT_144400 [Hypoxylon sp. FL0890]|nr:hypothetical protein F5Y06DRAFT_144400 [Hypoxylon sp. FL0890]
MDHERRHAANDQDPCFHHLKFEEILTVRNIIINHYDQSGTELCNLVSRSLEPQLDPRAARNAIKLVIRLLLLTKVEFSDNIFRVPQRHLPFLNDQSIKATIERLENTPPLLQEAVLHQFPRWFNVIDLEKMAGLKVEWADYITDHLTIVDGTLYVLRNVEALKYIQGSPALAQGFLTSEFISETIKSILLFFPVNHHDYRAWLRGNGKLEDWHQTLVRDYSEQPSSREVADYPAWGRRLTHVLEASNSEGAWSFRRLWHDTRNESLWWTRWSLITAVFLALVFGLIQSITGIIQVVYASRSPG